MPCHHLNFSKQQLIRGASYAIELHSVEFKLYVFDLLAERLDSFIRTSQMSYNVVPSISFSSLSLLGYSVCQLAIPLLFWFLQCLFLIFQPEPCYRFGTYNQKLWSCQGILMMDTGPTFIHLFHPVCGSWVRGSKCMILLPSTY